MQEDDLVFETKGRILVCMLMLQKASQVKFRNDEPEGTREGPTYVGGVWRQSTIFRDKSK